MTAKWNKKRAVPNACGLKEKEERCQKACTQQSRKATTGTGCGISWRGHCLSTARGEAVVRELAKLPLSPSQDLQDPEASLHN